MSDDHRSLFTRRQLLCSAGAATVAWKLSGRHAPTAAQKLVVTQAAATSDYLTPADSFGTVERGNPVPSTLPPETLREVGLDHETWQLELVPDSESDTNAENPLSKEQGTALDWTQLMRLAENHAVRYLKVMTCNNIGEPLGMGLWEGVPLREVIWLTRPVQNLRRVFYYG